MEFENVLDQAGGFGKFQKKLLLLCLVPMYCFVPWYSMNRIFILSVPEHWCLVPELEFSNLSIDAKRALTSDPSDPSCSMYRINYTDMLLEGIFKVPNDSEKVACVAGWEYDSKDYEETAATKWNMVCEYNYLPSLIFSLSDLGLLIGTTILGILADKFGRKTIFFFAISVLVVTELSSAIVNSFSLFVVLRIINGSGYLVAYQLPLILILELVAPNKRARINFIVNLCHTIGLCTLPLTAYLLRSWTSLCYATATSGLFILCYIRFIPESPSWQLSQDKFEEAKKTMIKILKENKNLKNQTTLILNLKTMRDVLKKKNEDEKHINKSRNAFLKYPRLRRIFFLLTLSWTVTYVACYSVTYNILYLRGNRFVNFFLVAVVELPGNVLFWYAMDRVGRRWTSSLGFFSAGTACLLPLIGFENSEIVSSMLTKFLITGVFLATDQQGMELFPTVSRSSCIGMSKIMTGVFGLLAPFISYLSVYGRTLPFLVIGCTCFAACVLCSFLPESLNENLPQTFSDSEKIGKDHKFFSFNWETSEERKHNIQVNKNEVELQVLAKG